MCICLRVPQTSGLASDVQGAETLPGKITVLIKEHEQEQSHIAVRNAEFDLEHGKYSTRLALEYHYYTQRIIHVLICLSLSTCTRL